MQKRLFSAVCLGVCLGWVGGAWGLDINHATEADLDSLKGVGPATTQRLLGARNAGHFTDWADLMARVKGLRAPTARKLSDQGLRVNGTPFEGAAPQAQPATPKPPPPGV